MPRKRKYLKSKRASYFDLFFIAIVLFVSALMIFVGFMVVSAFNNKIQAQSDISASTKAMINDKIAAKYPPVFDKLYLVIFIGSLLTALIGAWIIDTHPVFFVVGIIILIVICIITITLHNVYERFIAEPTFSSMIVSFPIINFFMQHILQIIIACAILVMIVLYAKPKQEVSF